MTRLPLLLLPLLLAPLTGCAFLFGPSADSALSEDLSLIVYPKEAPTGEDLDIIALKRGNTLTLVNRTPREYHDMQVWINRQYVGEVAHVGIGTENVVYLNQCINEFGEPFPVGGLLNPEKSYPVVLVELFMPGAETPGAPAAPGAPGDAVTLAAGQRHRMVVRTEESTSAAAAAGRSTESTTER